MVIKMDVQLIETLSSQGLGIVLSVGLVFYIIKTQEKRDKAQNDREENYQKLLADLSKKIDIVQEIKEDVKAIKSIVDK